MSVHHTTPDFSAAESAAMDAALAAAALGPRGANPLVGAVIIAPDGSPLITGYHRGAGTPHAEADAIEQAKLAGFDLTGTTMVVTLEPCNHVGRTGPCARAIIDAGIANVVYAVDDPHDPAAGGAATLRAAGVTVRSGLAEKTSLELNRRWFDAVPFSSRSCPASPRPSTAGSPHGPPARWISATSRRKISARPAQPDRAIWWARRRLVDSRGGGAPRRPGTPKQPHARRDGSAGHPGGRRRARRRRQGAAPAHPRAGRGAGPTVRRRRPAPDGRGRLQVLSAGSCPPAWWTS